MIGSKLGDYEILRLIGKGGMGAVYEALKPSINRRVAIKLLLPEYAEREDVVRRFINEARAVNAVNHPGVVQIFDVGKSTAGSLYLVMEYLDGETLSERLQQNRGRLPQMETITVGWQLAGALAAAHAKSIVHRDLKPGNVMLVPDPAGPGGERVKLLDFGIAKLGAAHLQGEDVKTRTGQIMGTAAYMSPEQFGGHKPTDGQSDVYSLACLMFRLLSGQQPFVSDSGEMAVAAMHMFKPAPPLQTLVPEAAPWLVSLIDSMLRKEPDERPTMAEVAALLQEALPDYAVSRKSLPPFRLEVSGATRLRDLELGTPDRGTPDRGRPSKPPPSELIAPTIDQPGASGVSSPSGSITGATGQASPPASRRMGRGAVVLVTGLSLISAAGVGGLLAWHHQAAPPKAATVPSQPVPPTTAAAPTAPTAPPPTSPPATPAAVATPSGSADKPTPATAAEPAGDANSESDPDQKNRRERAALKLGKPSKLGSHPDGRAKNKTPHATQIIN